MEMLQSCRDQDSQEVCIEGSRRNAHRLAGRAGQARAPDPDSDSVGASESSLWADGAVAGGGVCSPGSTEWREGASEVQVSWTR